MRAILIIVLLLVTTVALAQTTTCISTRVGNSVYTTCQ